MGQSGAASARLGSGVQPIKNNFLTSRGGGGGRQGRGGGAKGRGLLFSQSGEALGREWDLVRSQWRASESLMKF